jgi:hypothetical protein
MVGPDRDWRTPDAEIMKRRAGGEFVPPISRESIGLSLDTPIAGLATAGKRIYLFSSRAWSTESVHDAVREVAK